MDIETPARQSPQQKKRSPRTTFRQIAEFKGIRQLSPQQYKHHIRQFYDGPAGAVLAFGSMVSLHEPLVGHMIRSKKFDVSPFRSMLDIGSGAGQILGHLLKETNSDTRLVGCDLSHQMLRRAKKRLKDDRPLFVSADLQKLPFADASFDCITCGWVIEHLPDPKPGLQEMFRVLKPGGNLLLLATEDTWSGLMVSHTWKCRTYSRTELRTACEASGLPWEEQLYFTRVHRFFRLGGILVRATKTPTTDAAALTVDSVATV